MLLQQTVRSASIWTDDLCPDLPRRLEVILLRRGGDGIIPRVGKVKPLLLQQHPLHSHGIISVLAPFSSKQTLFAAGLL